MLLTNENFSTYLSDTNLKFHTSLGDISSHNLLDFCRFVDRIDFVDFGFDERLALRNKTIIFLNYASNFCQVNNYVRPLPQQALYSDLTVHKSDYPTLWVFGCSLSAGVGVDPTTVYHYELGQQLNLPVTTIARPGSSARWSLLQLMYTKIKPADIVVWQVTTTGRFTVKDYSNKDPRECLLKNMNKEFLATINYEQVFYDHITLVDYGIQYLRALQSRFVFTSVDNKKTEDQCLEQFTKYPEYCYAPDWIVDLGSDNLHPGVESHRILSNTLYEKIKDIV
jgi:hypothetical protein